MSLFTRWLSLPMALAIAISGPVACDDDNGSREHSRSPDAGSPDGGPLDSSGGGGNAGGGNAGKGNAGGALIVDGGGADAIVDPGLDLSCVKLRQLRGYAVS